MRWLFLNPIKARGWGGMEGWMLRLARGLRDAGDDCLMVGRRESPWPAVCAQAGLPFDSIPFGGDISPRTWLSLSAIVRRYRPDAAVAKGFRQARWLRLVSRRPAIAVKLPTPRELADTPANRWMARLCLDRILTDCHATRTALLEHTWLLPAQVAAVHNGVDAGGPWPDPRRRDAARRDLGGWPDATTVVAVVGRLTRDKHVDDALRAFADAARGRPAVLVVLGDGPDETALMALAAEMSLQGRIRWLGWRDSARELLWGADILLHPSRHEGLSNAVLEAMAAGLPVVAVDAGGTREAVLDGLTGLISASGDVAGLSTALRTLLADPSSARRMGAAGADRARRMFTIAAMASGIRDAVAPAATARALAAAPGRLIIGEWSVRAADLPAVAAQFLAGGRSQWTPVKATDRAEVWRHAAGRSDLYGKRFTPRTPRDRLGSGLRRPRALINYVVAHRLAAAGVAVVPHVAEAWRRTGAWSVESVLFTAAIPNAVPLDEWALQHAGDRTALRRMARTAGAWLAALHEAWVAPHDLKASNLLVGGDGGLVLLDLDNCSTGRPVLRREIVRNFAQFCRSFERQAGRREWAVFLAAYARRRRWTAGLLAVVLARLERRLRRRGMPSCAPVRTPAQ